MKQVKGWWLPDGDTYFEPILRERGDFDADRLALALSHVRSWGTAVDVGAHVGFFARTLVGHFARVVTFEPHPEHFACLRANLALADRRGWVVCVEQALGVEPGWVACVADEARPGNSGATYTRSAAAGGVPRGTLDRLALAEVDFLKVDVEGAEELVLRGAERTIGRWRPVVMVEVKKGFAERYSLTHGGALRWLEARGYRRAARAGSDHVLVPAEE